MAPDLNANTGCFWLETNRHSPRIFNKKNLRKLDISTINNKIDFMRSLNLFCIKNVEEFSLEKDCKNASSKNSFLSKKCPVTTNNVKCNIPAQSLKNQVFIESHKNLHDCSLNENDQVNDIEKRKTTKNSNEKESIQKSYIEYNNNNNNALENREKSKSDRKSDKHRRRSKNDRTKVTLKIGREVVSMVYCKKKYLNNQLIKEQKMSKVHHHENCKDCEEIKEILQNSTTKEQIQFSLFCTKKFDIEESDDNITQLHKMAAALIAHELQQKTLQNEKIRDLNEIRDNDAVVPEFNNDLENSDDFSDDTQGVLLTKNNFISNELSIKSEISLRYQQEKINSSNSDCEIITIDDDMYNDIEDDCIIIDEQIPFQNQLSEEENSFVFHVSDENHTIDALNLRESQYVSEKRKLLNDTSVQNENIFKKQKRDDVFSVSVNCEGSLNAQKIKENKYRAPAIKLSQFALPLRLINF